MKYLKHSRIVISVLFFAYLFSAIDFSSIIHTLQQVNPLQLVLIYFLFVFINNVVCPYKWKILLNSQNIYISLKKLIEFYFISMFFGMFIPGIGADIVRTREVVKENHPLVVSLSAVVFDRLSGLIVLLLIGLLGLIWDFEYIGDKTILASYVMILLTFLVLLTLTIFANEIPQKTNNPFWNTILEKVFNFKNVIKIFIKRKKVFFSAFVIALFFQVTAIYATYLTGLLVGINIGFRHFLAAIPLMMIASLLPVSLNGMGVREGTLVFLLSKYGVDKTLSFSLSLIILFYMFVSSGIGGVLWILNKRTK